MEEDLGAQEALVAHVDVEGGLTDSVDSAVLFDPLPRVRVVLCELFDNVRTDVTVPLLHTERGGEEELTVRSLVSRKGLLVSNEEQCRGGGEQEDKMKRNKRRGL